MKTTEQKKIHRIQVKLRRFAFQFGQTFIAVKEYRSAVALAHLKSFAVSLNGASGKSEIRKLVRAEILRRMN